MCLEGHEFRKIGTEWLFDLTTFIGYKVTLDAKTKKVTDYSMAFIAKRDKSTGIYTFEKEMEVPIKILRQVTNIILNYRKEALIEDEYCR